MKNFFEMWKIVEQAPMAPQAPQQGQQQQTQNNPVQINQNNLYKNSNNFDAQKFSKPAAQPGADPTEEEKLKQLLGKNYESFVNELSQNINDPKFLNFIKAGLEDGTVPQDDVVKFSKKPYPCIKLTPTQNEIDINGSLAYPLKKSDTQTIVNYLNGGTFAPNGAIVTCGDGTYIIDGHHRWSQLYCLNPNAQIEALDMTSFSDPILALKVTQLSIAATKNKIEVQTVKGSNLLTMGEDEIKSYIASNMSDNARQAFAQFAQGQDPVAYAQQLIWNNILSMRKKNQPISGASKRNFMPQTDSGGEFSKALQQGQVNWNTQSAMNNKMPQNMPLKQNASVEHEQPSLNEWLILSGVKKNS